MPFKPHVHREFERRLDGFTVVGRGTRPYWKAYVPGAVTRALTKTEIAMEPKAQAAFQAEGDHLRGLAHGTSDLSLKNLI